MGLPVDLKQLYRQLKTWKIGWYKASRLKHKENRTETKEKTVRDVRERSLSELYLELKE